MEYRGQVRCRRNATDALLVRDVNGNGLIDSGAELFGSATQDGFTALRAFDLNLDGKIDASDAIWSTLQLWLYADQDGLTDSGELVSLASRGVVSISLAATASTEVRAGNSVLFKGGYTRIDGGTSEVIAVGFATDVVNTSFVLPAGFEYDPDVFALPNLRGANDNWIAWTRRKCHSLAQQESAANDNGWLDWKMMG